MAGTGKFQRRTREYGAEEKEEKNEEDEEEEKEENRGRNSMHIGRNMVA